MRNISFLLLIITLFISSVAGAESDVKEGYDENTEIVIKGTVLASAREMGGPHVMKLRVKSKIYYVVTAPPWFLMQEGGVFAEGAEVEVIGSKYVGRDGNLYVIGRQLSEPGTGNVVELRDSSYRPLWKGHRMHRRGMP
ncbi:MAG: hypothetical protein ACM3ON_04195 [Chloroflexota bacterium]